MITILNGKLTIPESERFIGFAGDNLRRTVKFLISGAKEADRIYRLYLTFDDGTVNYFVLPSQVTEEGVVLTWQVLREHIFMSGCVRAQLKAFSDTGVVYHTTTDRFFVGDSAEFSDYFENNNTEFIEYEQRLNELAKTAQELCVLTPFIGENGNWYIYSTDAGEYIDSGKPSVGQADSMQIASGAVTADKIASGAVTATKLGQYAVTPMAIQPNAVTRDAIGTGAVTSEKIASGAVTEDKLADNCIDVNHLKLGAVSPDNLDRAYLRLEPLNTVTGDSSFHNLLVKSSDEVSEPFKKVVLFLVRPISEGITANIKKGRCFGFFVSNQEFWFTNINYNITYRVMFDDSSLISVESLNINLAVIKPENDGDDGGEQLKNYIDDNYIGYFPTGGASYPYVFYNFYTPYPYENVQFKIALSSYSLVYFYKRECHLDTDGQIEWTNWQELMARTNVDQTYNPESENAQSGKAVAEAMSSDGIPTYWQKHLDERIATITDLQNAGGKDSFSFIVITDMHYEQNLGKLSPVIAKKIANSCGIKYILILGDSGTRNGILYDLDYINTEWGNIEKLIAPIRHKLLITDGNHDGSYGAIDGNGDGVVDDVHGSGNSAFNFTPEKKYSLIKRKVSLLPDVVFDESGCGYYADDKISKVRYIVLSTHNNKYEENEDSSSKYSNMNNFRFGQSQFDMVVNALNTLEDGWSVVVASHVPLDRSGELLHWGATEMEDNRLVSGEVECWLMADVLNAFVNRTQITGSFAGTQGATAIYKNLADKTSSDWLENTRTSSSGTSAESGFDVTNFLGDGVTPVGDMTIYYKNATMSNQRLLFYNANKEIVYSVYPTTFSDYEGFDGSATEGSLFIDKEKQAVLSTTAVYVRLCLVSGDTAPIITLDEPIEASGEAFDTVSVNADFTNAKGTLIGYFGGHVHKDGAWDSTYTWDGRLKQCDFWTIATRCDSKNENDSGLLAERIKGTVTEQSFDVFTVNTKTNTIYATKIGAGSDREISY